MSEPCPEDYCGLSFDTAKELQAHLEWDHNYNPAEAEARANE